MSKEEELRQRSSIHLSQKHQKHHKHHMAMPWHDFIPEDDHDLARTASLPAKAAVVGRVGLMMLSCGTGAWRVRDSMNVMARKLGLDLFGGYRIDFNRVHMHRQGRSGLYASPVSSDDRRQYR